MANVNGGKENLQALQVGQPLEFEATNISDLDPEQIVKKTRQVETQPLHNFIDTWRAGRIGDDKDVWWKKFEDFCVDLIKITFKNDFESAIPTRPQNTRVVNGFKSNRPDINLSNSPKKELADRPHIIWNRLIEEYNCKQLKFDCKNYSETNKITNKEIYQLFEYLDPEEVGRIGFILSKYGNTDGSAGVAMSSLKRFPGHQYKFIILKKKDIEEWISSYEDTGSVTDFFETLYSRNTPNVSVTI